MSNIRTDEQQWLRYHPPELIGVMRAGEAWGLRVAGAYLVQQSRVRGVPVEAAENMRHLGAILNRISDARMEYLGTDKYQTSLESMVGASSFDVISRFLSGEAMDQNLLISATDTLLASLKHIDTRTGEAGFLNPERLESLLTRGD